ncbi:MAG: hypothetical protein ACT4OX_15330 [Actinomycetota bacterium]
MMSTTARHWTRRSDVPDEYAGVVWASLHIEELLAQLTQREAPGDVTELDSTAGPDAVMTAVQGVFGTEPLVAELPLLHGHLPDRGVWRVDIPGARSPASATRRPWPVG